MRHPPFSKYKVIEQQKYKSFTKMYISTHIDVTQVLDNQRVYTIIVVPTLAGWYLTELL